jgi:ATP-dependent helicase/nuclease subunit A
MSLDAYTPEQVIAIASGNQRLAADPRSSAWVEASAGSGKTKVLTDRVLRLMLDGVSPQRILCLTFTKAAAAEMSLRIGDALGEWAIADDATLDAALAGLLGAPADDRRQRRARRLFADVLEAPGGMKIMTIHAFCQSVLRRFPLEAGIAPHFEVMQDGDARDMLADAQAEVLAGAQREGDPIAAAIVTLTSRVHETRFAELLDELTFARARLDAALRRHGGPAGLATAIWRRLGIAPETSEDQVIAQACADGAFDAAALRRAVAALAEGAPTDRERSARLADWLAADPAVRAGCYEDYIGMYLTQTGSIRKSLMTKGAIAHDGSALAVLEAEAARLLDVENRRRKVVIATSTVALIAVGAALLDIYRRHKSARALLDYDDLILTVRRLLRRVGADWVLYKLDGGIDHVLVDEAQDTNPEQWAVIRGLVAEFFAGRGARDEPVEDRGLPPRTVFAVGDVKQSIYSFQGAEPRQFGVERAVLRDRAQAAERRWCDVALDVSFRSTPQVLHAVDAVFAAPAARRGLVFEDAGDRPLAHLPRRAGDAGRVELWTPVEVDAETVTEPWKPPVERVGGDPPRSRLARLLARRIASWIGNEMLEARGRPIAAGDIMVLVRRRGPFVAELVRALKELAVPVAGVDRMVLTEQLAVMDLMALGAFLLLPEDDLTLATVLKGPLAGLTEDELFELAWRREGDLWSALRAYPKAAPPDDPIRRAGDMLADLLGRVDFERPYEFYATLLDGGGRAAILRRLGADAADPLDEFLALAQAYERTNTSSLQGFVHWLAAGRAEIKRDLEGAGGAVRVMTVHGAKGLQAPVVILPDTLQKPRQLPALLWPDGGPDDGGVPLWLSRAGDADEIAEAARRAARDAQDEEYRRLLYVAMTRAEDRLYVCGWQTRQAAAEDCWYHLIRDALAPIAQETIDPFLAGDREDIDPTVLRLAGDQRAPVEMTAAAPAGVAPPLPGWARTPPPPEPHPPRPLAPSRPDAAEPPVRSPVGDDADDALRFRRGTLVHRLLQALPALPEAARADAAARFLARPALDLTEAQQAAIAGEVLAVMGDPAFAGLFGPDSLAEVPLTGLVAGADGAPRIVSGQLDRLVVTDDAVTVVDYKTNRPPPESAEHVPRVYLSQMAAYRALLRDIYPGRAVRCALLWTDGPRLMALDDATLDRAVDGIAG